jgi:hypothetical protein
MSDYIYKYKNVLHVRGKNVFHLFLLGPFHTFLSNINLAHPPLILATK